MVRLQIKKVLSITHPTRSAIALGVGVATGLSAMALLRIWRGNKSSELDLNADLGAVAIAQRRGYSETEPQTESGIIGSNSVLTIPVIMQFSSCVRRIYEHRLIFSMVL